MPSDDLFDTGHLELEQSYPVEVDRHLSDLPAVER